VNSRYLEDDDLDTDSNARELSLSPSTLLGIFFLLAIICAIFFGFGYSMGHRSATASPTSAENNGAAPLKVSGDAKPSPALASQADDLTPADAAAAESSQPEKSESTPPVRDTETLARPARLERAVATPNPQLKPTVAVKTPAAPTPSSTSRPAVAGAPALVQIAAVSHQEDADILVNALKRRGYTVAVRHEPQDKLLHVQLGPFPTRKDADVMKQRLSADGYNAIVK
jgi:cell division septation protein DedD